MEIASLTAAVRAALLAHPDVSEAPHRFDGVVFRLGRREIGHLHGDTVADLPFPPQIRDELIAAGRVLPSHGDPDSAWVSRRVYGPDDVAQIVELFRISLEHVEAQAALAGDEDEAQRADAAPDAVDELSGGWRELLSSPARFLRRARSRD